MHVCGEILVPPAGAPAANVAAICAGAGDGSRSSSIFTTYRNFSCAFLGIQAASCCRLDIESP
jgi:hypothetical protein